MIIKTNKISFKITKKNHLKIKPNFFVDRQYPELEDLEITPSTEEQKFKSNMYGYDEVTVKGIETEELNVIPNTETQINEGIFNKVIVSGDSNLISENIKEGTTIFGVEGTNKILDTTDATATVEDIAKGKTAYVNGEKIEGTVETIEGSASSQSQKIVNFGATIGGEITFTRPTLFKKNASNMITLKTKNIAETIKLTPEQIVKGNTVLGVSGIAEVLDTSDATATENDILEGKTAYVNNKKIQGILKAGGEENTVINPNGLSSTTASGDYNILKKLIVKLPTFDVSNFQSLDNLFYYCQLLTEAPILNVTNKTKTMIQVFSYCSALTKLDLSNWDISNVTKTTGMFNRCSALTELNLDNWDTSNNTSLQEMFAHCELLAELNINHFKTDNVTSLYSTFYNCKALTKLNLSNWNTSNVTTFFYLFNTCSNLTELNVSGWNTSNVTNMNATFKSNKNLTSLDLSSWDLSKVTNIENMLYDCPKLVNFRSFKNLGKGYTSKSNNYSYYTFNITPSVDITVESLIDLLLNGLYDLNLTYNVANGGTLYRQRCMIGSTNIAKLQATEEGRQALAEADRKGWNVT